MPPGSADDYMFLRYLLHFLVTQNSPLWTFSEQQPLWLPNGPCSTDMGTSMAAFHGSYKEKESNQSENICKWVPVPFIASI